MKRFLLYISLINWSICSFCQSSISNLDINENQLDVEKNNELIVYEQNLEGNSYWEIVYQPITEDADSISEWKQTAVFPFIEGKKDKGKIQIKDRYNNVDSNSVISFIQFFEKSINIPKIYKEGLYEISFDIDSDGKSRISGVKTRDGNNFDKYFKKIESMPLWKPAINGKGESVGMKVIVRTKENAQFPGGDTECFRWIQDHIKYPEEAINEGIEGTVLVSFEIECDGTVSNATVLESPHPILSKEVLRIMKRMPKWKPAIKSGKPIKTKFSYPAKFRLN